MQPVLQGATDTGGLLRAVSLDQQTVDGRTYGAGGMYGLLANSIGYLFNGATFDRLRSASSAVLAAFSAGGAALVSLPGDWGLINTPAVATQATISKAAVAGTRHVATSISATLSTNGTAGGGTLVLRDGATGAGTVLWAKQVILPVNGVWDVSIAGLNLVGSVNTAMTLEFQAAGPAASLQSVSLTGHEAT